MSPEPQLASLCVAGDQPMSTEATPVILEQCSAFRFDWGGGGVIPEIPSAVYRSAAPPTPLPLSPSVKNHRLQVLRSWCLIKGVQAPYACYPCV